MNGAIIPRAGFRFRTASQAAQAFADETRATHFYHRYGHSNPDRFARSVAERDGAEDGIALSSGMAAIVALTATFVQPFERIASSARIYGGTYHLFANILPRDRAVRTRFIHNPKDVSEWKNILTPPYDSEFSSRCRPRICFLESPGNPLFEVYDIAAIAEIAHNAGTLLVVDNTIATPVLQQPLRLGADLVVYSATKYLTQGLMLSGIITGSKGLISQIRETVGIYGLNLGVFESWFGETSMPHLDIRIKQHSENAWALASSLARHPKVTMVRHPGFQNMQERALVHEQMQSCGSGMLSFMVRGGKNAAWRVMNRLVLNGTAEIVPHLGETGTMVIHPASTTHAKLTPSQRESAGIAEGLIRVSVGIEDKTRILKGFNDALSVLR